MKKSGCRGYRFPPEIISYCVWLYFRFSVSYRDIEELISERGVTVTYETIRAWCYKFGQDYAKRLRARRGQLGDTWHLDEICLKIDGRLPYLWRAVDQDGSVLGHIETRRLPLGFLRSYCESPRAISLIVSSERSS